MADELAKAAPVPARASSSDRKDVEKRVAAESKGRAQRIERRTKGESERG
jgi:hypothetical protein